MQNSPQFEGQKITTICPKTGEKAVWESKYHNDELRWWCPHKNSRREREVVDRKRKVV